jgi:hypothetical protein
MGDRQGAADHAKRLLAEYPDFQTRKLHRIYARHRFEVGDRVLAALHAHGVPP